MHALQGGSAVLQLAPRDSSCDDGPGWTGRYLVQPSERGAGVSFTELQDGNVWDAVRMASDSCEPDFSSCETPQF